MECVFNIIGGDYNVVRDSTLDRSSNVIYHKRCKEKLDEIVERDKLVDIWRVQNPDRKFFTYMRAKEKLQWSRIDYFLISDSLESNCVDCDIKPAINTDHSLISLTINTSETKRGPGIWRFNNEYLNDPKFIEDLKCHINEIKQTYNHMEEMDHWELLKFEIGQFCKERAREKSLDDKIRKFNLYRKLGLMQEELMKTPNNEVDRPLMDNIEIIKHEIDAYATVDAKRAAFRCRKQWVQEGEKCSKYYFNLEKRNFCSKTMYVCKRPNGSLTKDYREILSLQHHFYEELYRSDKRIKFTEVNRSGNKLDEGRREQLDTTVTMEEL